MERELSPRRSLRICSGASEQSGAELGVGERVYSRKSTDATTRLVTQHLTLLSVPGLRSRQIRASRCYSALGESIL